MIFNTKLKIQRRSINMYNQTSLIRTPKGQNQVSTLQRCLYFGGRECMIFGFSGTKQTVRDRKVRRKIPLITWALCQALVISVRVLISRSAEMFWKDGRSTIQFFHFQRFCDKSLHRFIWHKYLCSMLRSVSLSNSGLRHPCGIPLVLHARVFKSIIFSMFLHCISMISPQLHTCMI